MDDLTSALRPAARAVPASGIIEAVNYGREKPGLIPLWAGEGDLPTPRFITDAAAKALADGETFYTYQGGIPPLREALADYYGRQYGRSFDPYSFFVTGSGMQAIQICVQLTAGAGEEILVPTPAWPNVTGAAAAIGARAVEVPMAEEGGRWQLQADALEAAVNARTRALFINSPANPTGWVASREDLEAFLEFARRHGLWIIADEIYARFVYTGAPRAPSFLDICAADDRILFVNTFSKNWAMTGWRIGWIHAPAVLRPTVESLIQYSTSGVAPFMQRAAVAALNEGDWFVDHMVDRARKGREVVSDVFSGLNRLTYAAPDGAFYAFFKIDGLESSRQAAFALIDKAGVGTAPGTAFGRVGEGFVRVCFARSAVSLREAVERIATHLIADTA